MDFYEVKNWKRFQHYKDRNPPWIKLHYELLTSEDWVMLDDASKLLAVACMLLASRYEGRIPNNPEKVRRMARIEGSVDFKPLIDSGFLIGASTVLADARPKTEAEPERENKEVSVPNLKTGRASEGVTMVQHLTACGFGDGGWPESWFEAALARNDNVAAIATKRLKKCLWYYCEGPGKDAAALPDRWAKRVWDFVGPKTKTNEKLDV